MAKIVLEAKLEIERKAQEKASKIAEEEARKKAEEEAKKQAEIEKKRKLDDAKFNTLIDIMGKQKTQKLLNYLFNGGFDRQKSVDDTITVKIFDSFKCIVGWEDKWNGNFKINVTNIDSSLTSIEEDNGKYKVLLTTNNRELSVADVDIKSNNLPDYYIEVLEKQSLFPPSSKPKALDSIVIPLSNIDDYEFYVLERIVEKFNDASLCK